MIRIVGVFLFIAMVGFIAGCVLPPTGLVHLIGLVTAGCVAGSYAVWATRERP